MKGYFKSYLYLHVDESVSESNWMKSRGRTPHNQHSYFAKHRHQRLHLPPSVVDKQTISSESQIARTKQRSISSPGRPDVGMDGLSVVATVGYK